eukprot:scaffold257497_cov17-Prasinocladus_malaysianus.AAC.1
MNLHFQHSLQTGQIYIHRQTCKAKFTQTENQHEAHTISQGRHERPQPASDRARAWSLHLIWIARACPDGYKNTVRPERLDP